MTDKDAMTPLAAVVAEMRGPDAYVYSPLHWADRIERALAAQGEVTEEAAADLLRAMVTAARNGKPLAPLVMEIAAPPPAPQGWMPIESAPKDGRCILVSGGIAYWREQNNHWEPPSGWYTITGFDWPGRPVQWEVTHWMEVPVLPIPPAAATGPEKSNG